MKKVLNVLVFLLIISLFVSCSDTDSNDSHTDIGEETTDNIDNSETTNTLAKDDLPAMDFNGYTFNIYTRTTDLFNGEMNIAEASGDVLNDAKYLVNRNLEERFNFIFNEIYYDYSGGSGNDTPRTYLLAADDSIDLFNARCVNAFAYATEKLIYSIHDIDNIDLDKIYWDDKLYNDLAIGGVSYFAVGAFNTTSYDFTHMLLFNKNMINSYDMGNVYQIVLDNKWTYDTFFDMMKTVTNDVNGDGAMNESDVYGLASPARQVLPNLWISADTLSIEKDSSSHLVFNLAGNEKFINVFEKIFDITWTDNVWRRNNFDGALDAEIQLFVDNGALFLDITGYQISYLRSMDTDFGILPYPKYEESQELYLSRIEGCELFIVPLANKDIGMTGAILESLAAESYNTVLPAYYEVTLKTKITRDEESSAMLDLIFANRVFDYGDTIFCTEIRDGVFRQMFAANNRDLISKIAAIETSISKKMAEMNG